LRRRIDLIGPATYFLMGMFMFSRLLRSPLVHYVLIGAAMPIGYATAGLLYVNAAWSHKRPPDAKAVAAAAVARLTHIQTRDDHLR
jgi:hypothetical protein